MNKGILKAVNDNVIIIVTVMNTTWAVVKMKPEKIQACAGVKPMTSAILVQCFTNWELVWEWNPQPLQGCGFDSCRLHFHNCSSSVQLWWSLTSSLFNPQFKYMISYNSYSLNLAVITFKAGSSEQGLKVAASFTLKPRVAQLFHGSCQLRGHCFGLFLFRNERISGIRFSIPKQNRNRSQKTQSILRIPLLE